MACDKSNVLALLESVTCDKSNVLAVVESVTCNKSYVLVFLESVTCDISNVLALFDCGIVKYGFQIRLDVLVGLGQGPTCWTQPAKAAPEDENRSCERPGARASCFTLSPVSKKVKNSMPKWVLKSLKIG